MGAYTAFLDVSLGLGTPALGLLAETGLPQGQSRRHHVAVLPSANQGWMVANFHRAAAVDSRLRDALQPREGPANPSVALLNSFELSQQ
jgi:hypothetical protein